jgi:hypothetical protein
MGITLGPSLVMYVAGAWRAHSAAVGYGKPSGRNANGQLLRDAATLHWSSSVNELLVSLIAQKGSSCYIVALS